MHKVRTLDGEPVYYEETDFVDDNGIKRTNHEFVKVRPDRTRVRIPIKPPIVVTHQAIGAFDMDQTRHLKQHEIDAMYRQNVETIRNA